MKREKGKLTIPVTGRCEACGWISNLAWVLAKLYLIGRDGSIGQVNPTQNEHKQKQWSLNANASRELQVRIPPLRYSETQRAFGIPAPSGLFTPSEVPAAATTAADLFPPTDVSAAPAAHLNPSALHDDLLPRAAGAPRPRRRRQAGGAAGQRQDHAAVRQVGTQQGQLSQDARLQRKRAGPHVGEQVGKFCSLRLHYEC